VTLAEHYGVDESENVADEVWMFEAARNNWPVFCCDSSVHNSPSCGHANSCPIPRGRPRPAAPFGRMSGR
jgi:hypothetical protein